MKNTCQRQSILNHGIEMKIELFHASKYGNGAKVAEEFRRVMATRGVEVNAHHIREANANDSPPTAKKSSP